MKASISSIFFASILPLLSFACSEVPNVQVTFYGYPDNSPPGPDTAYDCGGRNNIAGGRYFGIYELYSQSSNYCSVPSLASESFCLSFRLFHLLFPLYPFVSKSCPRLTPSIGTGTYDDPLTFASDPNEYDQCEIIYLPYLQKYLRMEDECTQCSTFTFYNTLRI